MRIFDLQKKIARMNESISEAIAQALESADFIQGMAVKDFETDLEVFLGNCMHAVTVGNGTDALVITLKALGIGAGDEVIVPAFTYVATAEAVILSGATAGFVDVLCSMINYARCLKSNPEDAVERTNKKFMKRFMYL